MTCPSFKRKVLYAFMKGSHIYQMGLDLSSFQGRHFRKNDQENFQRRKFYEKIIRGIGDFAGPVRRRLGPCPKLDQLNNQIFDEFESADSCHSPHPYAASPLRRHYLFDADNHAPPPRQETSPSRRYTCSHSDAIK